MSNRTKNSLSNQPPLFEMESDTVMPKKRRKKPRTPVIPVKKTWPEAYGKQGSYVNVQERAQLLITALGAFSARNSRMYFPYAAALAPHDKEIEDRYGEDLPNWLTGAKINKKGHERLAATSFWRATGLSAMRKSGLIRPEQIDPLGEIWWDDFEFFFKNKRRREDRNDYVERLKALLSAEASKTEASGDKAA